ncbi:MAG: DUF4349 domain-containing protein [Anaerolineales bacterium]
MIKRIILTILILGAVITACSPSFAPSSAPEPLARNDTGGGFAPAEQPPFESEEKQIDQDIDDSTTNTGGERIVIKNANMSIVVSDPVQTMETITNMAEEMGGFVVSSNLYYVTLENGVEVPQANVTFRVPAERLTEAISQIESGAGRILSKNVSGKDVTQEYTDMQSRLRNLQAAETQLQGIMDEAKDTEDVLNVYNRLVGIREQIEVIQGRIRYFEQSATFSSISLDILADEAVQPLTIGGWQPVGVAKDAIQALINTLKGIANTAIWIVLFIIPVAIVIYVPLNLIWRGVKRWRSRWGKDAAPKSEN